MLHRVVHALQASRHIHDIRLIGPGRDLLERDACIEQMLRTGELTALEPASSPSASVLWGLERNASGPVLVTTADHALLRAEMIDYFLEQSLTSGCDVTVAVTPLQTVRTMFPETRRTALKLQGGPYCGSNLFAFMTEGSEKLAAYWRQVERQRKNPRKVIARALGLSASIRYLLGRLSLDEALARVSDAVGVRVGAVIMPFPEAAVDVDSVADHRLVEQTLLRRDPA